MLEIMLLVIMSFALGFRIGQVTEKKQCEHEWKKITKREYRDDGAKYPSKITALYQCTKCKDTKEVDF